MTALRILLLPLLLTGIARADVTQTANLVEQKADKAPKPLAIEFRMRAAQAMRERYPELARKFVNVTLEELRAGKDWQLGYGAIQGLVALAPDDAISLTPRMGPGYAQTLINALAQAHKLDAALALFRDASSRGQVSPTAASGLLAQLVKERPAAAGKLFQETLASIHFDALEPGQAWSLITAANAVAAAAPGPAADAYEGIIAAVAAPDYGDKAKSGITASFQIGSSAVMTNNSRDTLLLAAGARLRALAPERFEKRKSVFERWDLSAPVTIKGVSFKSTDTPPANSPEVTSIQQRMSKMRGLPTDADRGKLATALAGEIQALPAGSSKLNLARGLCSLSTEGDLGKDTLRAVAIALAKAMQGAGAATADDYLELAKLVRYERVPAPVDDPALDAAGALLQLHEQLEQEAGFTLRSLDGKTYTLSALKGHVVLLNFWATWCPPCRKEMPDMEKLYKTFEKKGLIVLAVSDEDRETVEKFLQTNHYTFPILLDPGREVNTTFHVEGIPKSFIFDRMGKLAAQAIDMRTEQQFLELLKAAGLE